MVVVEARQLSLLNPPLSRHRFTAASIAITSCLFDPISNSLALRHSDASFSLYSSISLLSISSLPSPSLFLPPTISSAAFFHLRLTRDPSPDSIFIASSPLKGGTAVLLRFYVFNPSVKTFGKLKVVSNHSDLRFDPSNFGVVFGVSHGASVKLAGGINVFALYSVTNSKIWVFSVRMLSGCQELKLMKCAVIDCVLPVFTMNVSFGHLILGEENGVRVFQLRALVKGRVGKDRSMNGLRKNSKGQLENSIIKVPGKKVRNLQGMNGISLGAYHNKIAENNVQAGGGKSNAASNDLSLEKHDKHSDSVKSKTLKLRQDTKEYGTCFLPFKVAEGENSNSIETSRKSAKAVSIQALSANKFLILDSDGLVYLLALPKFTNESEIPHKMEQLNQTMKARRLASFSGSQSLWISDNQHTVHMLSISEPETPMDETDTNEVDEERQTQLSVTQYWASVILLHPMEHVTTEDAELIDSVKIYPEEFFGRVKMLWWILNPKKPRLFSPTHSAHTAYLAGGGSGTSSNIALS